MTASHSCTYMMGISHSTTSQRCSIGLRSGDCGDRWSTLNSCHVRETSLRWFEVCDMVHYPAGSSHQKLGYTVVIKGRDGHGPQQYSGRLWHLSDTQLVVGGPKCAKKISPTPLHHHHQPEQFNKGGWIHAFMLFTPNSGPTIWMSQLKSRIMRLGNIFPIFYCPILVNLCKW